MNKLLGNIVKFRNCNVNFSTQSQYYLFRRLSYQSDLSLEKIYPKSRLQIYTPTLNLKNDVKFSGYIPIEELDVTYSRSSGPGGQNVNCVDTKVDVRFKVETAKWIPEVVRTRLLEEHKTKINKEGYFIIKSSVTRSQQMNLADALEKLRNLIRDLEKPVKAELSPETLEKIRRRNEKAARERLMIKRRASETKAGRQAPTVDI